VDDDMRRGRLIGRRKPRRRHAAFPDHERRALKGWSVAPYRPPTIHPDTLTVDNKRRDIVVDRRGKGPWPLRNSSRARSIYSS
jgi:hypothetical protein